MLLRVVDWASWTRRDHGTTMLAADTKPPHKLEGLFVSGKLLTNRDAVAYVCFRSKLVRLSLK